jgi:hypothetical protein
VVFLAGLLGSLAVMVSTRRGLGVTPTDSLAYLTMADRVASGDWPYPTIVGVRSTHYPPGWSFVVGALAGVLPRDSMEVGRLVNAALVAALPLTVYGALRARAARWPWIAVLVGVYVAASYPLFELGSRAVSEPLFLVLLVPALVAIERAARTGSGRQVVVASVLVGALTLTRFVGLAAVVPLGLAVLSTSPTWAERAKRLGLVAVLAVGPTAAWYVLAPGSLASTHLSGRDPGGLDQLLVTIKNAGATLGRGVFLPAPIRYGLGLLLLAAPLVLVVVSRDRAPGPDPWLRRVRGSIRSLGAGPWLWFLVVYTALVAVQRWSGGAPILARYWLPYWIVSVVLFGRCLLDWASRAGRGWQTAVRAGCAALAVLALYNAAQVVSTARSNAQDGITLNAVRFQESALIRSLVDARPDVIYADDTYLPSFQTYANGRLVPVHRISCHVEDLDDLMADVDAALERGERPVVGLFGRCRDGTFEEALRERFDEARVEAEPGVGVLLWPEGG